MVCNSTAQVKFSFTRTDRVARTRDRVWLFREALFGVVEASVARRQQTLWRRPLSAREAVARCPARLVRGARPWPRSARAIQRRTACSATNRTREPNHQTQRFVDRFGVAENARDIRIERDAAAAGCSKPLRRTLSKWRSGIARRTLSALIRVLSIRITRRTELAVLCGPRARTTACARHAAALALKTLARHSCPSRLARHGRPYAALFSSRSSRRRILPTLVFGRSERNSMYFGFL